MTAGDGRLGDELRARIQSEGVWLLDEGLPGTITYRSYRAPGQRSLLRKDMTTGAVAITPQRIVVWTGRSKHIDVPVGHPLRAALEITLDRPDRICIAYDAARFSTSRSGRVEIRLTTPDAPRVPELLAQDR